MFKKTNLHIFHLLNDKLETVVKKIYKNLFYKLTVLYPHIALYTHVYICSSNIVIITLYAYSCEDHVSR